jgi:hypothetical protein
MIAEPESERVAREPNQATAVALDLDTQGIINGIDLQDECLGERLKREISANSAAPQRGRRQERL